MVATMEASLSCAAKIIQENIGIDVSKIPMGGSAGGTAAGIFSLLSGTLSPGGATIAKIINLEDYVRWADLVLIGEGRIDSQTLFDKGPLIVARMAAQFGVPVLAVGGSITAGSRGLYSQGVKMMTAVSPKYQLNQGALPAMQSSIGSATYRVVKRWAARGLKGN